MTFPQSTLQELAESERQMVLEAEARFGKYWVEARASSILLSRCIVAVDEDRMHVGRFNAILKKHHLLAIMSTVRLHKSQAMWNLRQVLEAGAHAAFAIANPGDEHFFKWENGLLVLPPKLPGKRYDWLEQNHKTFSDAIKAKKDMLNVSQTHANIVSSHGVFRIEGDQVQAPFFDIEDKFHVKLDLWLAMAVALDVMKLFREVNQGHNVIEFVQGFDGHLATLERGRSLLWTRLRRPNDGSERKPRGWRPKTPVKHDD
jgi:hypothetical protein